MKLWMWAYRLTTPATNQDYLKRWITKISVALAKVKEITINLTKGITILNFRVRKFRELYYKNEKLRR